MVLDSTIIEFKGMPLFQKARFKAPMDMQGSFAEFACFFYVVEGSMMSFDARGAHVLQEKEAMVKNCSNYVQRYIGTEDQTECEAIAVYLYPDLLRTIYRDEVPSFLKQKHPQAPKKFVANALVEQFMNNLALYFEDPEWVDEELGILKLKELMMILLASENHQNIRKLLSEIFSPTEVAFVQTVEKNLFNPLKIEQLAFICHMSLSTFKREFKKAFGQTPAKYIKQRRLEKAEKMLLSTEKAISEIAYDTGFQDPTTFTASFHTAYGKSPTTYRAHQLTQTGK